MTYDGLGNNDLRRRGDEAGYQIWSFPFTDVKGGLVGRPASQPV